MYFNRFSRRYFLRGISASLALPFLPSIMRHAYAAGGPPLRYVQVIVPYGVQPNQFFTEDPGVVLQGTSGVYAKALSSFSGDFSKIIGSNFTPFRSKMSIIRGLNVLAARSNHNTSMPTCGSGRLDGADNSEFSEPHFPYSVDAILAGSAKIYPVATGIQRHVNFCPQLENYHYTNFSWNKINGSAQYLPSTSTTSALLSKFTKLTSGGTTSTTDPKLQNNISIMQSVYADYKSVRDSSKISSADKLRLESYMAHVDQTLKDLQATSSTASGAICSNPVAESETSTEAKIRNQVNVLVAAMACQLTRVSSLVLNTTYDPLHAIVHHDQGTPDDAGNIQKIQAQMISYLLTKMDQLVEVGGTLLDNSLVYWGNEFGEPAGSDPHGHRSMPVVVAGGANVPLQMGYYIDYRKTNSMPFNNFLVTLLNAMGLNSSDYERDGVVGFGEYRAGSYSNLTQFSNYLSTAERRKPLPFLYKGALLG